MTQEPESKYRLSFMQQGMLVHSLLYPGSGVDIEQLVLDLRERLDSLQVRQEVLLATGYGCGQGIVANNLMVGLFREFLGKIFGETT